MAPVAEHAESNGARPYAAWPEELRRLKPSFFVIGAQKSGTTSLFKYLYMHPSIIKPRTKEIHYFDRGYYRGALWYAEHFPRRFPDAALRSVRGGRCITGEASPSYLFHPLAPGRVAGMFPDARLIAILRNPIDRAFSHWRVAHRKGWDPLSFEQAVDAEPQRMEAQRAKIESDPFAADMAYYRFSYISRGSYADQLDSWLEVFPRERLLVLRSEDMFSDPGAVFANAIRFLGVPAWAPRAFDVHNKGSGLSEGISPELRRRLTDHFAPHNARLRERYGDHLRWDE